ncbi:type II toxin-antitoxin system Phd/YefM family antitoxin [Aeromicrobium sp. Leaf350]|uniref:type II toxin-antitoxin system Phd/YefM family antitoxin n=1 Tax=Aeromicrobium sp. Leaf350 TaxID=2876565 RepID=UPI001E4BF38D|nr:type II toxin-antitoxin system prevent-host-death family antitoxin [Aeromicrobium sp. Leaf350]
MTVSVGAYEAKTHLSKLLAAVEQGETIVITRHGKEVAHLTPPPRRALTPAEAVEALRELSQGITLGPDVTIKELIEEGRRW